MASHLLSIDLEDWFTSGHLRHYVQDSSIVHRIEETTYPILDLLESKGITATFFVLGSIAKSKPQLIKNIHSRGHEIASHGFSHTPLWQLTTQSFRRELSDTNQILEDICGEQINGFRAPYCSLDNSTKWAIPVLKEMGFKYDSSIFPMKTPRYGVTDAPNYMYFISDEDVRLEDVNKTLLEVPFSVFKQRWFSIPCTGGIYGRFLPLPILKWLLQRVATKQPLNFYFHPWETDSKIPSVKAPLYNRFIAYYNNSRYLSKIDAITDQFSFTSFKAGLQQRGLLHS